MKICAISDIHGVLLKNIPECDVLCIAGDICPLDIQSNVEKSLIWFGYEFIPWCEALPCKKVILVAGNHDFFLEQFSKKTPLYSTTKFGKTSKVVYLNCSSYKYCGVSFYGIPYVTGLSRWAFNVEYPESETAYECIPNCDVLISHTPPFEVNQTGSVNCSSLAPDYGSVELRTVLQKRKIAYIICGHVHSGNHNLTDWEGKQIVNVSVKNEDYILEYAPFEFIIDESNIWKNNIIN